MVQLIKMNSKKYRAFPTLDAVDGACHRQHINGCACLAQQSLSIRGFEKVEHSNMQITRIGCPQSTEAVRHAQSQKPQATHIVPKVIV